MIESPPPDPRVASSCHRHDAYCKVLIVDDDPQVAANIRDFFTEIGGYDATVALNPYEGLGKLTSGRFDLVLTDVLMPGMNGIELLKSIKQFDASMPVVMITGFPSVQIAIEAMKEGAADFITKPFQLSQIKSVAEKLARERALLMENAASREGLQHTKIIEQLNRRLSAKIKEISELYAVSEMFSAPCTEDDIGTAYRNIAEATLELSGCSFVMLMIADARNRQLLPAASAGLAGYGLPETIPLTSFPLGDTLLQLREPLFARSPDSMHLRALGISGTDFIIPACIYLPLLIKDELFGILYAGTRDSAKTFSASDSRLLSNLLRKACMTIENRLLHDSIIDNMRDTLHALVTAIEARDKYTLKHSLRVTDHALQIAKMLGCSQDEMEVLRSAGHLHDIGKIGISDAILLKRGDLSPSEAAIIHQHPVIGENILRPLGFLPLERDIIRFHHERWDGKGYPDGLGGEDIPLLSRILAVADSYDAMTTDRPYRQALQIADALQELRCCPRQFDARIVEAFFDCMRS